jgi:hypothetical protein
MFNRELAEHEAFRAAHPAPVGHNARNNRLPEGSPVD